jgi:leucine-zipper of insertion element IS481
VWSCQAPTPTQEVLVPHRNAPLSELGRLRLARCIVEQGWPQARAAERFQVSRTTAHRWASRYRQLGPAGAGRDGRPVQPSTPQSRTHPNPAGPQGGPPALQAAAGASLDRPTGRTGSLHRPHRPPDPGPLWDQPARLPRPGHRSADPALRAPSPRRAGPHRRQEARQHPRRRGPPVPRPRHRQPAQSGTVRLTAQAVGSAAITTR